MEIPGSIAGVAQAEPTPELKTVNFTLQMAEDPGLPDPLAPRDVSIQFEKRHQATTGAR